MPAPRRYANPAQRQAAYRARLAEAKQQEGLAQRIPAFPAVAPLPGPRRWQALTQHALLLLQIVQEEMQHYYDERSERWQESERGEAFLERLQAIQEAHSATEDGWR